MASIWFRHLVTDWMMRRQPRLAGKPFVLAAPEHGRMRVRAASAAAQALGIIAGMSVADARAMYPGLPVLDESPAEGPRLLEALARWSVRYTPLSAVDPPDGLLLDISGCAHLWGGEAPYLEDIVKRLRCSGYDVRASIADTGGAAWAMARFGQHPVVKPGAQAEALFALPPAALRLEEETVERLEKLGLKEVGRFATMPRRVLRRRFGEDLLTRLDQALGQAPELFQPIQPAPPYQERLPCLEPICTVRGIEIALERLLDGLAARLVKEGMGLRVCVFKGYRLDGNIQQIEVATGKPSRNIPHILKLFGLKINRLEPDLGFELFTLEAPVVEELPAAQEALWNDEGAPDDKAVSELLDRIAGRIGRRPVRRYLPDAHHWPERSFKSVSSLEEQPAFAWPVHLLRPLFLLEVPERIEVMAAQPDYPPGVFRYRGALHQTKKADGPERIAAEWWIKDGPYRDYYCVEDEQGKRYWLFRLGGYEKDKPAWFLHGFFP